MVGTRNGRLEWILGSYECRCPSGASWRRPYYHCWFEGRRLLERPFDEVLRSGEPEFPFCLCWANETWTRRWEGGGDDVLLHQTYSAADDLRHVR